MQLRYKFLLMALAYLLSLVANVALSAWCILVYFDSAFGDFEQALARQEQIEQVRGSVRQQMNALAQPTPPDERRRLYADAQEEIEAGLTRLFGELELPEDVRNAVEAAARAKDASAEQSLPGDAGQVLTERELHAFRVLDQQLGNASRAYSSQRGTSVREAAAVERQVITILTFNAAVGGLLCVGGLVALRRWVMQPVRDLRVATQEISHGHFDYRVQPRSEDELGLLAREVNQMCATIVDMQKRLVDRERLAAAGEMVTRVAHNIRNPLSGIRVLAEATAERVTEDPEALDYQQRIIGTIDRFEHWLRDLQQSVAPLELEPVRVDIRELLQGVATAVDGMLMGRKVSLHLDISPEVQWVSVDPLHFEQALAAMLTNAVQASPPGEQVTLSVRPAGRTPSEWELTVEDHGPGIAPELREKIFSPYFTTKSDGTGLGLPIAQKVVRLHGGELRLESEVGRGTRFIAVLPGRLAGQTHGRHPDH